MATRSAGVKLFEARITSSAQAASVNASGAAKAWSIDPGCTTTPSIQRCSRTRGGLDGIDERLDRGLPVLQRLEGLGEQHLQLGDVLVPLVERRGPARVLPRAAVELPHLGQRMVAVG